MPRSDEERETKCLMCETKPPHSTGWTYFWKGEAGFMCETCGHRWYEIGNFLNEAAARAMEAKGVYVSQTKDKFGGWRIYYTAHSDEEEAFIRELKQIYTTMYPEFSWEWD